LSNSTKEYLELINDEAMYCDGFDDAIIGFVQGANYNTVALYDSAKCIEILMERDGMDLAEAEEFFEFNTLGAYVGENTPLFATLLDE
jgi:hypothetical protein